MGVTTNFWLGGGGRNSRQCSQLTPKNRKSLQIWAASFWVSLFLKYLYWSSENRHDGDKNLGGRPYYLFGCEKHSPPPLTPMIAPSTDWRAIRNVVRRRSEISQRSTNATEDSIISQTSALRHPRLEITGKSFPCRAMTTWNSLQGPARLCTNLSGFKRWLKRRSLRRFPQGFQGIHVSPGITRNSSRKLWIKTIPLSLREQSHSTVTYMTRSLQMCRKIDKSTSERNWRFTGKLGIPGILQRKEHCLMLIVTWLQPCRELKLWFYNSNA